jgi:hypothetical protein
MRVCILGLPGHTMLAVIDFCRLALRAPLREAILNDAGTIQSFFESGSTDAGLVASSFPNRNLVSWIARQRIPTIIVVPDIYVCLAHSDKAAQEDHGLLPRAVSHSLSALAMARAIPGCVFITGRAIHAELAALRGLFAPVLGRADEQSLADAERRIISSLYGEAAAAQAGGAVTKKLMSDTAKPCQGLLDFVRHGRLCELEWPVTLFADSSTRARPALPQIDITGPGRYLYWGPYLHLPPGAWEARALIEIAGRFDPIDIKIEVYTETTCHSCTVQFPANGIYDVSTRFTAGDALEVFEFRLFIERGEIEGQLRFGGVRLRQLGPPPGLREAR